MSQTQSTTTDTTHSTVTPTGTMPERYRPDERIIDNRERLAELYIDQELTVRAIADRNDVDVSASAVHQALTEYGLTDGALSPNNQKNGSDTPVEDDTVDWTRIA